MTLRASVRLSVEPLEEGYPLGEIRLGPGVVEPALARLVAGETVAQRGGAGVYLFHVPHGEGEAQRRRSVRQGCRDGPIQDVLSDSPPCSARPLKIGFAPQKVITLGQK